jgi:hypothetical protein
VTASVQWLHLGAEDTLIASDTGAWVQHATLGGRPFAGDMSDSIPATLESTRHLLDGAIGAAERMFPRVQGLPMTPHRYAWWMVSEWYAAHHTVPLLLEVADRFTALDRPDLAEFAVQKYEEERGHDELALNDLRMLSYDAEAAVSGVPPDPFVVELVEYARQSAGGDQPVEFLGHVYERERQTTRLGGDFFAALDAALGRDAPKSFLRTHAIDFDIGHVEEAVSFIASLPASDRTAAARGCFRTSQIRHVSPQGYPSESELEHRLSPFETPSAHQPQGDQP